MNSYFVEHPEMVLGEIKMESTRFGTFEPVCKARKDIPLSELLSNAVQRINGEIPYKMSRPNVQKILYKNVQLVCLLYVVF